MLFRPERYGRNSSQMLLEIDSPLQSRKPKPRPRPIYPGRSGKLSWYSQTQDSQSKFGQCQCVENASKVIQIPGDTQKSRIRAMFGTLRCSKFGLNSAKDDISQPSSRFSKELKRTMFHLLVCLNDHG